MKNLNLFKCALLLCLGFESMHAQEGSSAAGGKASGSGGSASYTVGQVVYTTNSGSNGTVSQGVQQAYEISVVNGIEQAKDITLQYTAYPNPTTNFLILKIEGSAAISQCNAFLYDLTGKLILKEIINGAETSISMENIASGTYFLKLLQTQNIASGNTTQQEIKTFKIIKN
jgi:hypothetical protein